MVDKTAIKRSVIELRKEFGNVFPLEELITANPEMHEEDILMALSELEEDGIITLDDGSIQVNI